LVASANAIVWACLLTSLPPESFNATFGTLAVIIAFLILASGRAIYAGTSLGLRIKCGIMRRIASDGEPCNSVATLFLDAERRAFLRAIGTKVTRIAPFLTVAILLSADPTNASRRAPFVTKVSEEAGLAFLANTCITRAARRVTIPRAWG